MATKMLRPNVGIYVVAASGIADYTAPTLAELTADGVWDISQAVTDEYDLNLADSDTDDSISVTDLGNVSTPTYNNYTAAFEVFRDANLTADSVYNKAYELFTAAKGTAYYLIKRIGYAHDANFAVGQLVSIYGVKLDHARDVIDDGSMIRLAAQFLPNGKVSVNTAIGGSGTAAFPDQSPIDSVGTKLTSNQKVSVFWVPAEDVADKAAFITTPSAALINGTLNVNNISCAVAWDGFDLGAQNSNEIDDRSICDSATSKEAGFAQFSGALTFFRSVVSDTTGDYVKAFDLFKAATSGSRPEGYLVIRVGKNSSLAVAEGDTVSVFRFIADAVMDDTAGEDSVKFMVNFLPQGDLGTHLTAAA